MENPRQTPPLSRRQKLENIDGRIAEALDGEGTKLYAIAALCWDFMDTVIDLCIKLRDPLTKPHTREIRRLKRDYDHCIQYTMLISFDWFRECSTLFGELLHDTQEPDFADMTRRIDVEAKSKRLSEDEHYLMVAVHQALTVCEVCKMQAAKCNAIRRSIRPESGESMFPHFYRAVRELEKILPEDRRPDPTLLRMTANVIFNHWSMCRVVKENGYLRLIKLNKKKDESTL